MPLVKEPKPLPSPIDYVPPNGTPHKVGDTDTWWTLAERPEVKRAKMSATDLCYFNFKTRTPTEINWYLRHKVGCRMSSTNGKNYRFSLADQPGVIYLPKEGPPQPAHLFSPKRSQIRLNAWLGIGAKAGTMFGVVGIETLAGYVASLDDVGKGMAIASSINRLGVGVGATGGFCFIFVTGVEKPDELTGYQQLDKDFNLSLGANWGKLAKSAKIVKFQPLIRALGKIGAKTPSTLKKILSSEPDRWIELIKAVKSDKDYLEIDPKGAPNVFVFDMPLAGGGVEVSAFYGLSNFSALWDFAE